MQERALVPIFCLVLAVAGQSLDRANAQTPPNDTAAQDTDAQPSKNNSQPGNSVGNASHWFTWILPPLTGLVGGGVAALLVNFGLAGWQFRNRLVADLQIILEYRQEHEPRINWQINAIEAALGQWQSGASTVVKVDLLLAGEFSMVSDLYQHVRHLHKTAFMDAAKCGYTLGRVYEAKKLYNEQLLAFAADHKEVDRLHAMLCCLKSVRENYHQSIKLACSTLNAIRQKHWRMGIANDVFFEDLPAVPPSIPDATHFEIALSPRAIARTDDAAGEAMVSSRASHIAGDAMQETGQRRVNVEIHVTHVELGEAADRPRD